MNGVTFNAWKQGAYIPLASLLVLIRDYLSGLSWSVKLDEIAPLENSASDPFNLPPGALVTKDLFRLFPANVQIIDGELRGFDATGAVVVIIRAIDSTWWDVQAIDERILRRIAEVYPTVTGPTNGDLYAPPP